MFMQIMREFFACLIALVMPFSQIALPVPASFSAQEPEALQAQFSVVSDVHVDIYQLPDYINRLTMLRGALKDMAASEQTNDAVVFLGDTIDEGQTEEYLFFFAYLKLFNKLPMLMAMGNHEHYLTGEFDNDAGKFLNYYNFFTGEAREKTYYAKEINGVRYIVLGTESTANDWGDLSAEQNEWLDEQLREATQDGKPAFVFNHQPFGPPYRGWYQGDPVITARYDAIYETAAQYDNVFIFSGHLHYGLREGHTLQTTQEGVHLLNLSSFGKDEDQGQGFQVEVYADKVILRARNFGRGVWLEDFSYSIPLV